MASKTLAHSELSNITLDGDLASCRKQKNDESAFKKCMDEQHEKSQGEHSNHFQKIEAEKKALQKRYDDLVKNLASRREQKNEENKNKGEFDEQHEKNQEEHSKQLQRIEVKRQAIHLRYGELLDLL